MTYTFDQGYRILAADLLSRVPIHTGQVHAMDTSASPQHATYEAMNVTVQYPIPDDINRLESEVKPNLPWAEEHFGERVSGMPHNPPPSHVRWPWSRHNANHQDPDAKFSHTYPERFWPRYVWEPTRLFGNDLVVTTMLQPTEERSGIRYRYGDLSDVINLLVSKPLTRQAFLPVWFPEDTGATSGQRVPCTLGYHFMIRDNRLNMVYHMRSCDLIRYFRDDVYMAARLCQWMVEHVTSRWEDVDHSQAPGSPYIPGAYPLEPGVLTMHITSLHAFVGDQYRLTQVANGFRDDCERCQTDNHRCPGCGTGTTHDFTVCGTCHDIP